MGINMEHLAGAACSHLGVDGPTDEMVTPIAYSPGGGYQVGNGAGTRPPAMPPWAVVRDRVLSRADVLMHALLTAALAVAVAWFLTRWTWAALGSGHLILSIAISVPFLGGLAIRLVRWTALPLMRRPRRVRPHPGMRVGVATTYVRGVESVELLEHTVRALIEMDYPHETWVLDEGDEDQIKDLCVRLGARHFSRRHLAHYQAERGPFQSGCKHGNYNSWLYEFGFDRYDFVAAFDPDHVPDPAFLCETLGFFEDPSIGYVQAPQAYANASKSMIARGAAEESYAFYSCDQSVGDVAGHPIIIGCHNTHRVKALKQVGGLASHFADDILLTILYRRRGWKGVYVPRVLAHGQAPEDWGTYIRQQRRWARALLDLKIRVHPKLMRGLPLESRLVGRLHGLSYLKEGIFGLLLVASVVAGLLGNVCYEGFAFRLAMPGAVLLGVLAASEVFTRRFYLDPAWRTGIFWRSSMVRFAKWPFFLLALGDVLGGRQFDYDPTPKTRPRLDRSRVLWPHGLTALALGLAWLIGTLRGVHTCPVVLACGLLLLVMSAGLLVHECLEH